MVEQIDRGHSFPPELLSPRQKHVIGIYGGVGPLSHTLFEQILLEQNFLRGARSDQDHPVWILVSGSSTPDRTQGLMHGGESALNHMVGFTRHLVRSGADAIFVVCNTSHAYHREVQEELNTLEKKVPFVHMMRVAAEWFKKTHPDIKQVGLLGTDGTLKMRLYHDALESFGLIPVAPEVGSETQNMIMDAIYNKEHGIKATGSIVSEKARTALIKGARWCKENGVQAVIAACTEVSVGLTNKDYSELPIIDPLVVLANVALDIAWGIREPHEFFVQY